VDGVVVEEGRNGDQLAHSGIKGKEDRPSVESAPPLAAGGGAAAANGSPP
jgi:hypothetical protein